MVQWFVGAVLPGIDVRVEVHQRHLAVDREMRLQQRQADEVIATQTNHACALCDQCAGLRMGAGDHLGRGARTERHIARIHAHASRQYARRPRPQRITELTRQRRLLADSPRPEARAGPVGGGEVEGYAEDREIRPLAGLESGQACKARVSGPGHAECVR